MTKGRQFTVCYDHVGVSEQELGTPAQDMGEQSPGFEPGQGRVVDGRHVRACVAAHQRTHCGRLAGGSVFVDDAFAAVYIAQCFPRNKSKVFVHFRGFGITTVLTALVLAVSVLASDAHAHVVANWDKSARSWNNSHMTKIKAAMESAGHEVLPDSPITEQLLKAVSVLVIAEPTRVPSAEELSLIKQFVTAGGVLLLFGDTGIELPRYNNLLAGIGSGITYTSITVGTTSALPESKFTDAPIRIVGSTLTVTSGNGTTGGTLIDNNYVRYEVIGAGLIFAFGDRIDHDDVISQTNTSLLLNIVAIALGPVALIPTMSAGGVALMVLFLSISAVMMLRRRRLATRHG
jgi:hypothetical protein